jgi:hypothetical protein
VLQVRERADPEARRKTLARLRTLRFGAVLPFYTRHETANHVVGASQAMVDALERAGTYTLR